MHMNNSDKKGALLVLVLVFGTIFFLIVVSFMGFVITQSQIQTKNIASERALAVAEGGLNYYKWYLAHNPDDVTFGTGVSGPYEVPYVDVESGAVLGTSSLAIASSTFCGVVSSIEIESTGYTIEEPDIQRTIYARYAKPTVAEYAYIINANVWAGASRTIIGPYHSNGAIRMDGTNNSTVTSGLEDWVCDGTINCDAGPVSSGDTIEAVFGDGPNHALWNTGVPPIGFAGLTVNLATMQSRAQAPGSGGIFLAPSGEWGYRIDMQADSTIDVYVVNSVYQYTAFNSADGDHTERNLISSDTFLATYTIDDSCPLVFVEDKVWLEGEVPTRMTIAAADNDSPGVDPSMILHGNITYATTSAGLLAIAEDDMLVGFDVPNDMELNGIFIAQTGRFGRNHYTFSGSGGERFRNSLTINGTIVSNGRVGTQWTNSAGSRVSGFDIRFNSYDRDLVENPPPLAPNTSEDYKFVEWREVD